MHAVSTDHEAGVGGNTFVINNTATNKHIFFKIGQKPRKIVSCSTNLNSQGLFTAERGQGLSREERKVYLSYILLNIWV